MQPNGVNIKRSELEAPLNQVITEPSSLLHYNIPENPFNAFVTFGNTFSDLPLTAIWGVEIKRSEATTGSSDSLTPIADRCSGIERIKIFVYIVIGNQAQSRKTCG